MGMRAVTTVIDSAGRPRRFWSAWASPEFQIPHVAEFLSWVDDATRALTIESYLSYACNHPNTLPVEDVTDTTDDDEPGDLNYRYHLTLVDETRSLRLVVRDMKADGRVVTIIGRANLYSAAAEMYDLLARRSKPYDTSNGAGLPGGDRDSWRRAAADFRQRHQSIPIAAAAANLAAQFTPADHTDPYPSITVAGVLTLAYIDHTGAVRVSVHLDEAADWLVQADGTVPTRIFVNDTEAFNG
jgi:hypothetical protein